MKYLSIFAGALFSATPCGGSIGSCAAGSTTYWFSIATIVLNRLN